MSKKVIGIIIAIIISISAAIGVGAAVASNNNQPTYEDVPCMYGCPNSKRVRKLNLLKKKYI